MANITERVSELFKRFKITEPPIDVFEISNMLGVKVSEEELDDDISGFLVVKSGKSAIAINENHHPNRQRFTVAHELGHFCLHVADPQHDELFIDRQIFHRNAESSLGTIVQEREANQFAAELLMPEDMLRNILDEEDIDFVDEVEIHLLAKRFGVSEQAMGFRLGNLEIYS